MADGQFSETQQRRRASFEACERWAATAVRQHTRVQDALRDVMAQMRRLREDRTAGRAIVINAEYKEPWDRLDADRGFLAVSLRHLVRAVEMLNAAAPGAVDGLPSKLEEHVRALRNCVEHWDEENPDWIDNRTPLSGRAFDDLEEITGHRDAERLRWSHDLSAIELGGLRLDVVMEHVAAMQQRFAELNATPSWDWEYRLPEEPAAP